MAERPRLTSRPPAALVGDAGQATVLVVDDERLGAERVREMIAARGHRVIVAHSWTEAIQAFSAHEIDLVFMDAVMPNVDGFKLTRVLRERSTSYVPIVFLTGLTDERARRRSIEVGADDLLTKPVDELEFHMRLVAMLRIRRLTRALENRNRTLARLAKVDALTGLLNRRMLDDSLPRDVEDARRASEDLSVLMIDIDHFKKINDSFGHDAGDQVLVCLGLLLQQAVPETAQAYRYGGEELVVVAPGSAPNVAAELAAHLREEFSARSRDVSLAGSQTMSVGVASLSQLGARDAAAALLGAADKALYGAKRGGRDRVVVYGGDGEEAGEKA